MSCSNAGQRTCIEDCDECEVTDNTQARIDWQEWLKDPDETCAYCGREVDSEHARGSCPWREIWKPRPDGRIWATMMIARTGQSVRVWICGDNGQAFISVGSLAAWDDECGVAQVLEHEQWLCERSGMQPYDLRGVVYMNKIHLKGLCPQCQTNQIDWEGLCRTCWDVENPCPF